MVDSSDYMPRYYDRHGQPMTMVQWVAVFDDMEYRRIEVTEGENYTVSTVWLGLDHSFGLTGGTPLIFETMVFPAMSAQDLDMIRTSTEAHAREAHRQMVEKWISADGHSERGDDG